MRRLRSFPVASVKGLQRNCRQVESFYAVRVDVDFVGIGARDIKRCHPALRAKVVFRCVSIESVNAEIVPRSEQTEFVACDDPMEVAFLCANRAVALSNAIR